jgi:nucleoside-diphosphate-sugar epimerase
VLNAIIGTDIQPIYKPSRAGDVRDSQADISKACSLLGYRPIVSLQDGLAATIDWCQSVASAGIPEKPAA